jgi:thiosulfate/3-mercaptopyruvate sulfurtransferase
MRDSLVSTAWLAANLNLPALRIVDASWHMPGDGRDGRAEYAAGHIPGAVFLDLGSLADPDSSLPMMLPDPAFLAARMASLGISNHDRVMLYDNSPFKTATRAWWMLARVSGMPHVTILDGGLTKWQAEGHAVETATQPIVIGRFSPVSNSHAVRDKAAINANLAPQAEQILDARSAARFAGEEAESRPNLVAGHIPGSLNLHYARLFDANGCWKPVDGLRAAFVEAGVDWNRPIVTTCGSGISAAILTFALHLIGKDDVALYDGSWTDWGSDPTMPKAQGRG